MSKTEKTFEEQVKELESIVAELESGEFIELNSDIGIPKARMYASYIKRLSNKKINAVVEFFKANDYYALLSEPKK